MDSDALLCSSNPIRAGIWGEARVSGYGQDCNFIQREVSSSSVDPDDRDAEVRARVRIRIRVKVRVGKPPVPHTYSGYVEQEF